MNVYLVTITLGKSKEVGHVQVAASSERQARLAALAVAKENVRLSTWDVNNLFATITASKSLNIIPQVGDVLSKMALPKTLYRFSS